MCVPRGTGQLSVLKVHPGTLWPRGTLGDGNGSYNVSLLCKEEVKDTSQFQIPSE